MLARGKPPTYYAKFVIWLKPAPERTSRCYEMFRNAGKSWVAKILLMLLAGSFGVWGIQDIFGGFNATALATVGDQEISSQQYSNSYRQAMQNLAQQTGQNLTAEDARSMGIDRSILNNLIQSAAIDAQAANLKLSISKAIDCRGSQWQSDVSEQRQI